MKFNTKILTVAWIPFYGYLTMCAYVLVQSHFNMDVIQPIRILSELMLLLVAGILAAIKGKSFHFISLIFYMLVGIMGIYSGLLITPMNWMELVASAFVIAFGFAFYEMVEHHREMWHEED